MRGRPQPHLQGSAMKGAGSEVIATMASTHSLFVAVLQETLWAGTWMASSQEPAGAWASCPPPGGAKSGNAGAQLQAWRCMRGPAATRMHAGMAAARHSAGLACGFASLRVVDAVLYVPRMTGTLHHNVAQALHAYGTAGKATWRATAPWWAAAAGR